MQQQNITGPNGIQEKALLNADGSVTPSVNIDGGAVALGAPDATVFALILRELRLHSVLLADLKQPGPSQVNPAPYALNDFD